MQNANKLKLSLIFAADDNELVLFFLSEAKKQIANCMNLVEITSH